MLLVLMGVAGCGKTTIGLALSQDLDWPFLDGDDFHSEEARNKMAEGIPLTDADREPWLQRLAHLCASSAHPDIILACSALKKTYRETIEHGYSQMKKQTPVHFIHLRGPKNLMEERLRGRKGHFFNPQLLKTQFETLEPPLDDEPNTTVINLEKFQRPQDIVTEIIAKLNRK